MALNHKLPLQSVQHATSVLRPLVQVRIFEMFNSNHQSTKSVSFCLFEILTILETQHFLIVLLHEKNVNFIKNNHTKLVL